MGVAYLWHILQPVKQHVPLNSLSGKTLAVDLSLWVCEAQMVKNMIGVVTKPHLRNLFFRVSSLMLMGVKLVFVMEGEAPKVKAETMRMRNEMRYGPTKSTGPARTGRSYFNSVLKECLTLLECLGIPWVQAAGEAEAMCAYLDANGLVDGCITNDGDVFLYGACTVYRNFTMNVKDPHVDCYTTSSVKARLGLDRDSLVGIAVLLGCDYLPKGIPGVGKDQVLKLIKNLNGQSVLQRFEHWAEQFQNSRNSAASSKKVTHCSLCCHPGTTKDHEKRGCKLCGSTQYCEPHDYTYLCPCPWHQTQREKKANAFEYNIKRKAQACAGFPFREVIEEFLISKDKRVKNISWLRPNILSFQNFAYNKMEWPRHYSCEKVFALLTYYDMTERAAGIVNSRQLQATRIVKMRVRNGIPCFEIQWEKPEHYVFANDQPLDAFTVSIEEESLFQTAYPDIVALFRKERIETEEKKLKSKKNKPKGKELSNPDEIADLILQLTLDTKVETCEDSTLDLKELHESCSDSMIEMKPLCDRIKLQQGSPSPKESSSEEVFLPPAKESPCYAFLTGNTAEQIPASGNLLTSPYHVNKPYLEAPSPYVSSLISELQLSNIDWEAEVFVPNAEGVTSHSCKTTKTEEQSHLSSNLLASPHHSTLQCLEAPSPNVMSVISELQLSHIDWQDEVIVSDADVRNHQLMPVNSAEQVHASGTSSLLLAQVSKPGLEATSPSVTKVISELELSNIDWDASSFCSSPQVEAPSRLSFKALATKLQTLSCGNSTIQLPSGVVRTNAENMVPTSIQYDSADRSCVPDGVFVPVQLPRRPLEERVLLKNGCQPSEPQIQGKTAFHERRPQPLPLVECRKQASNSRSGHASKLHSACTRETEKIPSVKHWQKSATTAHGRVLTKSTTTAHNLEKKTKTNMSKAMVRSVETTKWAKASVSSVLKTSVIQYKVDSAVHTAGKVFRKSGFDIVVKKSVCRSPLCSSGEEDDTVDIRVNKQPLTLKHHRGKCVSAPLLLNYCADKMVGSSSEMKVDEYREKNCAMVSRNHFVFDDAALLSSASTSVACSSNEIALQVKPHRAPFTELSCSPGPHIADDDCFISDSPLPLSERIKMRMLQIA